MTQSTDVGTFGDDPATFPFPASDTVRILKEAEEGLVSYKVQYKNAFRTTTVWTPGKKILPPIGHTELICVYQGRDVDSHYKMEELKQHGYTTVGISSHGSRVNEREAPPQRDVKISELQSKTAAVRALKITQNITSSRTQQVYFKIGDEVKLLADTLDYLVYPDLEVEQGVGENKIEGLFTLKKFELGLKSAAMFECPSAEPSRDGIFGDVSGSYPFPENETIRVRKGEQSLPCYQISFDPTRADPKFALDVDDYTFMLVPQHRDNFPLNDGQGYAFVHLEKFELRAMYKVKIDDLNSKTAAVQEMVCIEKITSDEYGTATESSPVVFNVGDRVRLFANSLKFDRPGRVDWEFFEKQTLKIEPKTMCSLTRLYFGRKWMVVPMQSPENADDLNDQAGIQDTDDGETLPDNPEDVAEDARTEGSHNESTDGSVISEDTVVQEGDNVDTENDDGNTESDGERPVDNPVVLDNSEHRARQREEGNSESDSESSSSEESPAESTGGLDGADETVVCEDSDAVNQQVNISPRTDTDSGGPAVMSPRSSIVSGATSGQTSPSTLSSRTAPIQSGGPPASDTGPNQPQESPEVTRGTTSPNTVPTQPSIIVPAPATAQNAAQGGDQAGPTESGDGSFSSCLGGRGAEMLEQSSAMDIKSDSEADSQTSNEDVTYTGPRPELNRYENPVPPDEPLVKY
eukprot:909045_1